MVDPGVVTDKQISGNDWGPLSPRAASAKPSSDVTVVVCGAPDQKRLDPTLAALRHQDYPAGLLEVVVVAPADVPLDLPDLRPDRCRLVTVGNIGGGDVDGGSTGGGFDAGVRAASGEIIIRLHTGVICAPNFVSTLVRWQHASPEAVSLAPPARMTQGWAEAAQIAEAAAGGDLPALFPEGTAAVDAELATLLAGSHDLRTAGHLAFQAARGAPFAFHRGCYSAGNDPYRGDDIEVAYRLAQAGAVFVPDAAARAWVLPGGDAAGLRLRQATLPDLVPLPRGWRPGGRIWSVPLVIAVVPVGGPYELVKACTDRLLGGGERDLRVLLVGDWAGAGSVDLRLLATEYRSEPRVRLVEAEPDSAFPSPYLLRVPVRLGLGAGTLGGLLGVAETWKVGLVRALPDGATSSVHAVELWSTAARCRAQRAGVPSADLAASVAATHGQRWEAGSEFDIVDLAALPPAELSALAAVTTPTTPKPPAKGGGQTIPVGGARSLARAIAFVARRYAGTVKRRVVRR